MPMVYVLSLLERPHDIRLCVRANLRGEGRKRNESERVLHLFSTIIRLIWHALEQLRWIQRSVERDKIPGRLRVRQRVQIQRGRAKLTTASVYILHTAVAPVVA